MAGESVPEIYYWEIQIDELIIPNFATVSGKKAKTQILLRKISSYR